MRTNSDAVCIVDQNKGNEKRWKSIEAVIVMDTHHQDDDAIMAKQRKISPEVWVRCTHGNCKGTARRNRWSCRVYPNDNEKKTCTMPSKMEENGKKIVHLSGVVHSRVRYADCKGSHVCINRTCPYKVQCGVTNTKQFDKSNKCKNVRSPWKICQLSSKALYWLWCQ